MTTLLTELVRRAEALSAAEQDFVAQAGLKAIEDLRDEKQWDEQFAASQQALEHLTDEAISEYRAGQTSRLTA